MGFIWTFELIPVVFQIESHELYAISGVLNCLDGVFLFLIFGLNKIRCKKVYNLFVRRRIDMTFESSLYSVSTSTITNITSRSSPSAIVTTLQ